MSWEETQFYAQLLDFPTVPVLAMQQHPFDLLVIENEVKHFASLPSVFDSHDAQTGSACTREGIVTRDAASFSVVDHPHHVFKYVRKVHVKTDEHWTRKWQRARLAYEQ